MAATAQLIKNTKHKNGSILVHFTDIEPKFRCGGSWKYYATYTLTFWYALFQQIIISEHYDAVRKSQEKPFQ